MKKLTSLILVAILILSMSTFISFADPLIFEENNYLKLDELNNDVIKLVSDQENYNSAIINKKAKVAVSFEYNYTVSFSEGLAKVYELHLGYDVEGTKYGWVNKEGELVIPLLYDNASNFSEGLALVTKDGKAGWINKQGEAVIPIEYDRAFNFSEGLALVTKDAKSGWINRKGEIVIPIEYDSASIFFEGLARVKKDDKLGFINKQGEVVIPIEYDSVSNFFEGFARVRKDGKSEFINKQGEVATSKQKEDAISIEHEYVFDFSEFTDLNNKSVEMRNSIYFLNKKGIINGKSNTSFDPEGKLSRAEYSKMIVKMFYELDKSAKEDFPDVQEKDWYRAYVASAKEATIINGYPDNTFRPNRNLTNEEALAVMSRILINKFNYQYLEKTEKSDGLNINASNWAEDEIVLALHENVVHHYELLNLQESITRGQVCIFLKRLYDRIY